MSQAIHILKKDSRFLWREISAYLIAVFAYFWTEVQFASDMTAELLLAITAVYLIVRNVQAEPLVGSNQFWITRPYYWSSLLLSKLMFIAVVVSLPVLLARGVLLVLEGFPIGVSVAGLIGSTLQFVSLAIFVAALAALTGDFLKFALTMLAFIEIGLAANDVFLPTWLLPRVPEFPYGIEWIRSSFVIAIIPCIGIPLLYLMYRYRRPRWGWRYTFISSAAGIIFYWALPAPLAIHVQSWIAPQNSLAESIQVHVLDSEPYAARDVRVPISVSGIPKGFEVSLDAVYATFHSGGQDLTLLTFPSFVSSHGQDKIVTHASFSGVGLLDQQRGGNLTIHAVVYGTLFGNPREEAVEFGESSVDLDGGLIQCYMNDASYLFCRSPFDWPRRLVQARFRTGTIAFSKNISYARFPVKLGLSVIEQRMESTPPRATRSAQLHIREPVAHFRRVLEVSDFQFPLRAWKP